MRRKVAAQFTLLRHLLHRSKPPPLPRFAHMRRAFQRNRPDRLRFPQKGSRGQVQKASRHALLRKTRTRHRKEPGQARVSPHRQHLCECRAACAHQDKGALRFFTVTVALLDGDRPLPFMLGHLGQNAIQLILLAFVVMRALSNFSCGTGPRKHGAFFLHCGQLGNRNTPVMSGKRARYTRSSATRATIEGRARIAAAKQKSLPQATSASMGSDGADCLEAQAHWPCGHARGLNGKMLSPRTKQEPLSQPRSASGKLASRIGSKEKRRVAALRERRLRAKSAARLPRSING